VNVERPLPVAIAAYPTVDDVIIERIERDVALGKLPEGKLSADLITRAMRAFRENGITQV
jgi:hypothetical protein